LFFQNSISVRGSGCLSPLRALSGSCFSTFLIYFVHVMIAPKVNFKLRNFLHI
jgi:hypothetical protein